MKMSRRDFIGCGLAVAVGTWIPKGFGANPVRSSTQPRQPVYFLRSGSRFDDAFLSGLSSFQCEAHACPVDFEVPLLADWASLVDSLRSFRGARLIGIAEEWRYALFDEAFREAGAAMLCRGHHIGEAALRHHFVSTRASQGIGELFAQALNVPQSAVWVDETPVHEVVPVDKGFPEKRTTEGGWVATVATLLSQVTSDNWTIAKVRAAERVSGNGEHRRFPAPSSASARHVSFAIQI